MIVTNRRIRGQIHPHPRRRRSDCAGAAPTTSVMAPALARRPAQQTIRHEASFIIHLIADAERAPQTGHLRRAMSDDAVAAYRATTGRNQIAGGSQRTMRLTA